MTISLVNKHSEGEGLESKEHKHETKGSSVNLPASETKFQKSSLVVVGGYLNEKDKTGIKIKRKGKT